MRPAGFIVDVPVTLSVAVRGEGLSSGTAKKIARRFAQQIELAILPEVDIFNEGEKAGDPVITEIALESSSEESCEILDELEPDDYDE